MEWKRGQREASKQGARRFSMIKMIFVSLVAFPLSLALLPVGSGVADQKRV